MSRFEPRAASSRGPRGRLLSWTGKVVSSLAKKLWQQSGKIFVLFILLYVASLYLPETVKFVQLRLTDRIYLEIQIVCLVGVVGLLLILASPQKSSRRSVIYPLGPRDFGRTKTLRRRRLR